jgi:type I restriction enzyme R subunit
MKSANFKALRDGWPELVELGGSAEAYAHADPAGDQPTFVDLLKNPAFCAITPKVVLDKVHVLRIHGNKAAHGEEAKPQSVIWLLKEARDLARWLLVEYGKAKANHIPQFKQPSAPQAAEARERRQILEKLAAQEAQMDALLRELDAARQAAVAAEKKSEELKAIRASADAAATLRFDEATPRTSLIDSLLSSVGWDVGAGLTSTEQVGKEIQVDGQPTDSGLGYADYVLWDHNGNPLAVIEAKKTSVDPERGRHQAKLYADSLEKKYGHRPVIFYTDGFDIWIWDDAQVSTEQTLRIVFEGQPPASCELSARRARASRYGRNQ